MRKMDTILKMSLSSHVTSQTKMYLCGVCGQEFQTKWGYIKHELAHKRTFKCETCRKQYTHQTSLFKHKKSALCTAERKFICSTCCRSFSTLRELIRHNESHRQQTGGQIRSAINGATEIRTLRLVGIDRFDLVKFLANVRPGIEKHLLAKVRQNGIKWYVVAEVELVREDRDGEVYTVEPFFRSFTYRLLSEETFKSPNLNHVLQKLVVGLEKYIQESSRWILPPVKQLDMYTYRSVQTFRQIFKRGITQDTHKFSFSVKYQEHR